ncbi:MAG: radical SAM protein [Verrucomicrobiae bacterium]|nr:radical SAM protein [Verrucomicrobiae bacterium]
MTPSPALKINEIYLSVQGESSFSGQPCVFVRLTGCDLRCSYCDTPYAFFEGQRATLEEIAERVESFRTPLVELTGGEPLLQPGAPALAALLCDRGHTVLIETSGAHDISKLDRRVIRILDVKTPSSGESARNRWENLADLRESDELKFVIGSREDFDWARERIREHSLERKVRTILFSPVFPTPASPGQTAGHAGIDPKLLVEWILAERLPVRFQLQIHKFVWPPSQRGV